MVAERRFTTPQNYAYFALMLASLLRPDLQQYAKLEQDGFNPAISSSNPYNLTGVAFTAPFTTNYGNNFNFIPTKQNLSMQHYDPLSQYLNWPSNSHFDNNGIAMILGDTQVSRNHLDSESGYSSDEVHSPLSTSSYSTQSSRPIRSPFDDLSEIGAAGFTPPQDDYSHSLEDYVDLEYLANVDPNKPTKGSIDVLPNDLPLTFKQEPDLLLEKLLKTEVTSYSPELKTSPGGNEFHDDFSLALESKDFDPIGVNFDETFTNNSFQYPFDGDLENIVNFDELASLDFSLPSDILSIEQSEDPSVNIENQLEDLIQSTSPLRNGSGEYFNGHTSTLPLDDNQNMGPNIPTTSKMAAPRKIKTAKKKVLASKKIISTSAKSMKSPVSISDDAIVDMAVDEFNELLETLTEDQAKYVRDVRRRGKNKEAARICRKRKLEVIDDLEDELKRLKLEKQRVLDERRAILEETSLLKAKVNELEASVFKGLTDEHGRPLSSSEYSLLQGANGTMYLGKNIDNNEKKNEST